MGTKFRLAECYEAAGLTGSAWKLFSEVSVEAIAEVADLLDANLEVIGGQLVAQDAELRTT